MIDITSETFHIDLREARLLTGLNQTQFAKAVGINTTPMRNFEASPDKKNARRPSEDQLQLINDYLDCHVEDAERLSCDEEGVFSW